jgi:2-polyprenyl-6-methoxyphenol hydroxylase-like FAD-dependent oxidoreductase
MLGASRRAGAEIVTRSMAIGARANGTLLLRDGPEWAADLVIGADGVKSRVRDSFDLGVHRKRFVDGLIRVLVRAAISAAASGNTSSTSGIPRQEHCACSTRRSTATKCIWPSS